MIVRTFFVLAAVLVTVACGNQPLAEATQVTPSGGGGQAGSLDTTCSPTDQAQYVYRPARLQVVEPCVRVVGTVVSSSAEADGDVHLQIRLDPAYQGVLRPGNQFEDGNLIVEPVCQFPPLQADAIRVCASDPDPLLGGLPGVGEHVWMEGRYILDSQHHAWAELHPLYRWGAISQ